MKGLERIGDVYASFGGPELQRHYASVKASSARLEKITAVAVDLPAGDVLSRRKRRPGKVSISPVDAVYEPGEADSCINQYRREQAS